MNSEDEKLASRIAEILARLIQEGSDIGSIPAATYRIQLNHRFTFKEAAAIIPYLSSLGVTHIYTSPYLMAKSESLHGYDISDHNALNPEIGSEEEYGVFIKKLRAEGLGQVIDIVPNHMGITESKNRWWMDVLENGPSSAYAHYFDIDWNPVKEELRGKVLLPILGDQYGKALERQELSLVFEESGFFALYDHRELPIAAQTYPLILRHRWEELERRLGREYEDLLELELLISALDRLPPLTESDMEKIAKGNREKEVAKKRLALLYAKSPPIRSFIDENIAIFNGRKGDPHSFDLLDRLLNVQAYRLANWRVAADEINYRRFFDINDLASISMERPEVFEETHRLIFRLIREGKVQGLRIDHPDGLYDPLEYIERLQRRCLIEKAKALLPPAVVKREEIDSMMMEILDRAPLPLYLIVEKILSRGERLPTAWPVHGTVGYEFAHTLNGLFIDATHAGAFDQIYSDFIGERLRFQDVVYERKKMVMNTTMASEINVLARRLNRLSEKDRLSRDFTLYSLRDAIREIIACFPVYRTYIGGKGVIGEEDRRHIETAIWKAKQRSPAVDISVFDYLKKVLLLQYPDYFGEEDRAELLTFVKRFQQTTGPVMAKGLEDTACYIYNRMISLNEVGGDLPAFGVSPVAFHEQNRQRREQWPYGMLTTSTHDTKRSEDVRARINVLSELPEEWRTRLRRWSEINETKKADCDGRPAPDFNEEYLLYQTLLGAWPFEKMEAEQYETFVERIEAYMAKATKEAKVNTSWISPNQAYDDAVTRFVRAILDRSASNRFLEDFLIFQRKVAHFGLLNSLSQLLLKIASPGVPDIYQGCDLWDFSLVDPDNRRPVDFARRAAFLRLLPQDPSGALLKELLENKTDGRIKLYITWKALTLRKRRKTLFLCGEYLPLQEEGRRTGHLIAFGRRWKNRFVIAAAPRLLVSLTMGEQIDPIGPIWEESWLRLPPGVSADRFQNVLTGEIVRAHPRQGGSVLALPEVFSIFPVALLIS